MRPAVPRRDGADAGLDPSSIVRHRLERAEFLPDRELSLRAGWGRATVKTTLLTVAAVIAVAVLRSYASAATCSEYSTQAEAQRAADTRDADGDGIYCESLPCPGSAGGGGSTSPAPPPASPPPPASAKPSCSRPSSVQRLVFSAAKYPNIKSHTGAAILKGWPRILVLNANSYGRARRSRCRIDPGTAIWAARSAKGSPCGGSSIRRSG
jgi:hypothetical protein